MALIDGLTNIGNAIREKTGTSDLIPFKDMPQAILSIVSGGGTEYTDIVFGEDNTIILTDTDGNQHTMECVYEDKKIKKLVYDGVDIDLTYDGDNLVAIGGTEVDLSNAPVNESVAPRLTAEAITTLNLVEKATECDKWDSTKKCNDCDYRTSGDCPLNSTEVRENA